jgi:hypothetical protein
LVRQIYQKVHEAVGIRIPLLDAGAEELKQKIQQIKPEFDQLIEIRDGFKNEIRNKSEDYANQLADDFCEYLSNLDKTFENDFKPYEPDLKIFDLLRGGKRKEFEEKLEQAFNQYSNEKMSEWTKRAESKLKEAFLQLAGSAKNYGDAYSQATDQISAKLTEKKIETGTIGSENKSPGWTRWAGAAAGIFLGNPAGAALVGFGALDWKSIVTQFVMAVGVNIALLYGASSLLGPMGIGLVGAVTGAAQLQMARSKLVNLAKEEMKKNLPNIANKEKITVYNSIMSIFKEFEDGVISRIDSDILSRKAELQDLLAQKESQEIDKKTEIARLNTLDSQITTQWNNVQATCDKVIEEIA